MTSKIVWHAVVEGAARAHPLGMPRKARSSPKPTRHQTHIKAWRKHRGLTLEKLTERLLVEEEIEISDGQLSRIERGKQPYSQDLLEALARVLRCDPADLIVRDPTQPEAIWSIWEQLSGQERTQAVELLKVLKKTGTHG